MLEMERDMQIDLDDSRRAGPSSVPDTRSVSKSNKALAAISGAAVTSLLSECRRERKGEGGTLADL